MKNAILFLLMVLSSNLMAQIGQDTLVKELVGLEAGKRITYSENDTIPIVVYLEETSKNKNILWYLNGQVVDGQVLSVIDPNNIEELKVEKEEIEANGMLYKGAVYVKTKENYELKLISLNALKAEYLTIPDSISTLFMLNGSVVSMDYDQFLVDHDYILKIEVQFMTNPREDLDLAIVQLTTRTKENLEEANTIRIRGAGPYGMNTTSH